MSRTHFLPWARDLIFRRSEGLKTVTVKDVSEHLNLKLLVGDNLDKEVKNGYCGDLLSWVMSKAQSNDCWFTVIGNVNAVAVAMLTDVSCVVLTEDAVLDDDARQKASIQDIIILQSDKSSYELSYMLAGFLND